MNRRFRFRRLIGNRRWCLFPCQTQTNQRPLDTFSQNRILSRPFPERTARTSFQLITAVCPSQSGTAGILSFELDKVKCRFFIRLFSVKRKTNGQSIDSITDSHNQSVREIHSSDDAKPSLLIIADAKNWEVVDRKNFLLILSFKKVNQRCIPGRSLIPSIRQKKEPFFSNAGRTNLRRELHNLCPLRNLRDWKVKPIIS